MMRIGKRRDDAILEECLECLMRGESVAQCLERYPERAARLAPALDVARRLLEETSRLAPAEGFYRRARQRLLHAFAERGSLPARRRWLLGLPPRLAAVAIALLLFVVVGLGSTYGAAANSVPGEPFYRVKETVEQVRLAMARSPEAQVHLNARLTEERAVEARKVLLLGRAEEMTKLEERIRNRLHQTLRSVGVYPAEAPRLKHLSPAQQRQLRQGLFELLRQQARRQAADLQHHLQTVPPEMKPYLRRLLLTLEQEYRQALQALAAPEAGGAYPSQ